MSRHKVWTRPSINDMIAQAPNEEELQNFLLSALKEFKPSAATKRKWKEAAEARGSELRKQKLMGALGQGTSVPPRPPHQSYHQVDSELFEAGRRGKVSPVVVAALMAANAGRLRR